MTNKSFDYLLFIQFILIIIYVVEIIIFLYLSAPIINKTFHEISSNEKIDVDEELKKIIIGISQDTYLCYHCIQNRTTFKQLELLIKKQEKNLKILNSITLLRGFVNTMNIINLIVVFFIYGGPLFHFVIALLSMIILYGTFFLSQRILIMFDSVILIVSMLTMIKCLCSLERGKFDILNKRQ